jgi:hypothetical protein
MGKTSFAKPSAAKPAPTSTKAKPAAPATKSATPPAKKTPSAAAPKPRAIAPPGVRTNAAAESAEGEVHDVETVVTPVEEPTPPARGAKATPPKAAAAPATATPDEDEAQIVVREPNTVSNGMFQTPVGQAAGEFDASDYNMPMLKLMQSMSPQLELNDELQAGDWTIGGAGDGDELITIWREEWEPLVITILRYEKQFMQQLDYGSDEMPKLYHTAAQAEADGLVPFGGHEVGYVAYANSLVLIKMPPYEIDGIEAFFPEEFGEDRYALALWRITGTAYKFAGRKIMSQTRTRLKAGLHTGSFTLEARKEKGKITSYFVPQLRDGEMHGDEFIAFATELAGG